MENNNPAKNLIEKLINADDVYLSRVKSLGDTLKTLLKGKVPEGILQDLQLLDSMNPAKKRNFLKIILFHLNSQPYNEIKLQKTKKNLKIDLQFLTLKNTR